jgi:hypothetical protein
VRGILQIIVIGLLILQIFLLGSCGLDQEINKVPTASPAIAELTLFREGTCQNSPNELSKSDLKLKSNIESFFQSVTNFSYQYNKAHSPHLSAPSDLDVGSEFATDPLNPLRLSKRLLLKDLLALKSEWLEKIGSKNEAVITANTQITPSSLIKIENVLALEGVHKKVHALKRKFLRLSALSCSKAQLVAREKFDVRPIFKIRKKLAEGFNLLDPTMEALLLDLCTDFNTSSLCSLELLMNRRNRSVVKFYQNFERKYEQRLSSFFKIKGQTKWSCFKNGEKTIIRVPIQSNKILKNKLFGTLSVLKEFVAEKWGNKKVQVLLEEAIDNEESLEVSWTEGGLSYVLADEPSRIYLSKSLNFSQLNITFAHELGHVFGFPDCYHEFYEKKSNEIIYYSLDKSGRNLMCTLGHQAKIPDSYLDKLVQEVCL